MPRLEDWKMPRVIRWVLTFGIESSIIALLGYVIVTLAAICMIKKKAKV